MSSCLFLTPEAPFLSPSLENTSACGQVELSCRSSFCPRSSPDMPFGATSRRSGLCRSITQNSFPHSPSALHSARRSLRGETSSAAHQVRNSSTSSRRLRSPKPASPEVAALLSKFISQTPRPLTLSKLLSFGHPLSPQSVISSASYALSEIPRRMSERIRALENLPFIVGTNPYIARTLEVHRTSFEWLATYPEVKSIKENADFSTQLEHLVQCHSNDIPTLAKG